MEVNNSFYDQYGDRWYTAYDDPIALLRAEGRLKAKWVISRIPSTSLILDVGCGAGFLCNQLAAQGHKVTGIDQSASSLQVAATHDPTRSVRYVQGDALQLPFEDASFDVVTNMDFLEHVDRPEISVRECARVLKPGGLFFYHTFNRSWLSHLFVIKSVEWFVKNTPERMHVLDLFIKPKELIEMCKSSGLTPIEQIGIRPVPKLSWVKMAWTREVPRDFEFETSSWLGMSYMGLAVRR